MLTTSQARNDLDSARNLHSVNEQEEKGNIDVNTTDNQVVIWGTDLHVNELRTALNVEATTIHDELRTVFGDEAPSYRTIARWAQWLREGREEIEDEE
ncbi:unnamed protein product [Rotaria sordida]|uniref:Mos1 transposase HTH domain-containing protein n=1 Tax=Rotaria sordida TaxID=392033 RepID=A0A816EMV3_9BILA|nr:unnamed protein product [Rotaria sordida]CAF1650121.1 unnamed protein product [Rotaria sordida]